MNRDHADFDTFVVDCTSSLLRTAYLIVWDLQEAEDLVQETLFEVAITSRSMAPPAASVAGRS